MKRSWILVLSPILFAALLALAACTGTGTGQTGTEGTMGGSSGMATDTSTMGTATDAAKVDCSTVRCAACPEGQTPALKPPNCCKCVPVDMNLKNCDNVRCAACPTGQHPALTPPDCCRCVPD